MRFSFFPLFLALTVCALGEEEFYKESAWKPRAVLPSADALSGNFWPASPAPQMDYDDPEFDASRLTPAPPPGVYPRVLVTPEDVEIIRKTVALGDKAPPEFRAMWEREKAKRSPFFALVTGDDKLGKTLAAGLVQKMNALGPKLDSMDKRPDRDNLWSVERSVVASGDPDPPTEIWALLDYDYLHRWMTPEERTQAEQLIARITKNRVSNFMVKPDHFLMNNHKMFGMEFLRLLMLIEGTSGFDQAVYDLASHKARVMLAYYLSPDGMCYESIKGWLNNSVYVALARRHPELLKHSRLRAKMRFFQHALHWQDGRWQIREEMRASAFHVIWMMRYFHPENRLYDWLYQATLTTHPFLTDPSVKWPDPVGINPELLLLFAAKGKNPKPTDWNNQAEIDKEALPTVWKDDERGYLIARNSWDKDDLQVGFTTKQDFYYGGHEGSENNRLVLWADGINWVRDSNMLAVKATFLQNMLTIDGKGLHWPPAPGVWLGVQESEGGVLAAGDGKNGYDFSKVMQVHPLDFPSAKIPYYAPFAHGNFDLTRDHQIAFHPGTVKWNDGYAHTDYGPWSGETRLVESYKANNPVEKAYRTVYLARGKHPYVLVIDDARKDDKERLYEFNLTIPEGIDLLDNKTPEIMFQSVPPGGGRENDLLLGPASTPRDDKTGAPAIPKEMPLFLVRTLWRNSDYGFPVPRFEKMNVEPQAPFTGLGHVTIPAITDSPEFRVLLYPHRQGDPLPVTQWNEDRTELTVRIGEDTDHYRFGVTDGGRTVFSVERNGALVVRSEAGPSRPVLEVRGVTFDAEALRTTRLADAIPRFVFDRTVKVKLQRPQPPAFITFTLDGTEPTANSPRYEAPFLLERTARLAARVIDPKWTAGPKESKVLRADFELIPPAKAIAPPADAKPGLLARVYEKKTVLWDDTGFFRADKIMLPDLDQEKPLVASLVPGFELPFVLPALPVEQQAKGFYRFSGWFQAPERDVYEFAVNSCGPVLMKVGGQEAIAAKGVFHQQQATRTGAVVLDAGWHPLELIVTDPLLWNLSSLGEMPFAVSVRRGAGDASPVSPENLRAKTSDVPLTTAPEVVWKIAAQPPVWMQPGMDVSTFERTDKLRDPDYLDVEGLKPLRATGTDRLETNIRPDLVRVYEGWFYAPEDGVYGFDLSAGKGERQHLGDLRGTFQNQLRVAGEIVVQRGIAGRRPTGKIGLKKGWHPVSLRLGGSAADGSVTYPDGQTMPITAEMFQRPSRVAISAGQGTGSLIEIYGPTNIELALPDGREGTIRFTLDGTPPTASSPVFEGTLPLDRSAVVTAAAFLPDGSSTGQNQVTIRKVEIPEDQLIASVRFEGWDGKPGATTLGQAASVWISPGSTLVADGKLKALAVHRNEKPSAAKAPVDVNVSRPPSLAGLKISGLHMRDNALTAGVWLKSDSADGRIFGKEGYSAFGKSYRTASATLAKGKVQGRPGPLAGGAVKPGAWVHVVLTADANESRLYVDGQEVAKGDGSQTLATDALDFFAEHPGLIGEIRLYDRTLKPAEVARWHGATKALYSR